MTQFPCEIVYYFINPYQPSVAFHVETRYLFRSATEMTGFYMKRNTELKWVRLNRNYQVLDLKLRLPGFSKDFSGTMTDYWMAELWKDQDMPTCLLWICNEPVLSSAFLWQLRHKYELWVIPRCLFKNLFCTMNYEKLWTEKKLLHV